MLTNLACVASLLLTASTVAQSPAPQLAAKDQTIHCPLLSTGPGAFRPIGRASLSTADSPADLVVRYPRAPREVAGAVLPLPPGNLNGMQRLDLDLQTEQTVMLVVSLHASDGAVHSWPAFQPQREGLAQARLRVEDLGWDSFQNGKQTKRAFAAELVQAISIVDLAGHFSRVSGTAEIAVRRLDVQLTTTAAQPNSTRRPGESAFFAALVGGQGTVDETVQPLLLDALQQRGEARPLLLLGLAALWRAAEAEPKDPRRIQSAMLADAYFQRVARIDPQERRLASWQVPVQLAIASSFGSNTPTEQLLAPLLQAVEADPHFHSFSLALIAHEQPGESPLFQRALTAVRQTIAAQDAADATLQNRPHWPHNREGYMLMAADLEWRAGQQPQALDLLTRITAEPTFGQWPHRDEVARRRDAWRAGDEVPGPSVWERQGCSICHRRDSR